MSVLITGSYDGRLKMTLTHGDSGTKIATDAQRDNLGEGSAFSPTDLVAAALGSCVLTTIGIVAAREGVDLGAAHFTCSKEMAAAPRRIGSLCLDVHLPSVLNDAQRRKYAAAAETCPVKHSLSPETRVEMRLHFDV